VAVSARIGQEHCDLCILDPTSGSGVLAPDTDGVHALLQITGLVDHQDPVGVAEPVDDDLAHIVTHRVGVPLRPVQQPLHRVRATMRGLLGQLPAGLDLKVGEQAGDEARSRPAGFDPGEPARYRGGHQVDGSPPPGRLLLWLSATARSDVVSTTHRRSCGGRPRSAGTRGHLTNGGCRASQPEGASVARVAGFLRFLAALPLAGVVPQW
jgi:hypothetical protein